MRGPCRRHPTPSRVHKAPKMSNERTLSRSTITDMIEAPSALSSAVWETAEELAHAAPRPTKSWTIIWQSRRHEPSWRVGDQGNARPWFQMHLTESGPFLCPQVRCGRVPYSKGSHDCRFRWDARPLRYGPTRPAGEPDRSRREVQQPQRSGTTAFTRGRPRRP